MTKYRDLTEVKGTVGYVIKENWTQINKRMTGEDGHITKAGCVYARKCIEEQASPCPSKQRFLDAIDQRMSAKNYDELGGMIVNAWLVAQGLSANPDNAFCWDRNR